MKAFLAAVLCVPLVLALGCDNKPPRKKTAAEENSELRAQIVGVWERAWDSGPGGEIRELNADGSLVMHELRDPNSPAGAATSKPVEKPLTMDHPLYKVKLKTIRRETDSWTVENRILIRTITLKNGDPLRISEKVERVSSTELVLSVAGTDGKKEETKFRRRG